MKPKQWCPGAGKLARYDVLPSSLVTCGVCNRGGLNGAAPTRYERFTTAEGRIVFGDEPHDGEGRLMGIVPAHQAKKTAPEDIGHGSAWQ